MKTTHNRRSAARTGAAMIAATVLSKALGVLRTALIAARFGTGSDASAYAVAEKLPLSLFELLIGSAVAACFIPAYQRLRAEDTDADLSETGNAPCKPDSAAAQFASRFGGAVFLGALPLTLLGILLASPLVSLTAPGLTGEGAGTAIGLLRILFWAVLPAAGTAVYSGLLQSHGCFLLPAGVSVISNAAVIVYLFLSRADGTGGSIFGLAAVSLAAWLLQFLTLAVPARRRGLSLFAGIFGRLGRRGHIPPDAGGIPGRADTADTTAKRTLRTVLRTAPTVLLSSWLLPGGALCGLYFASSASADGTTVFNYAHGIFLIAAGILTYSVCNYLFPALSAQAARDRRAMEGTVRRGMIWLFTLTLPAAVLLTLLARPAVAVLYERSAFTAQDTEAVTACLRTMAWALPAFAANELGARIAYALGRPRRTACAAIAGLTVQCAVGAVFSHISPRSVRAAGFGCALGIAVSACILLIMTAHDLRGVFQKQLALPLLSTAAGACIAGGAARGVLAWVSACIPNGGTLSCLLAVLCAGGAGIITCLGWLIAVRHLLPAADALPGIGRKGGNV